MVVHAINKIGLWGLQVKFNANNNISKISRSLEKCRKEIKGPLVLHTFPSSINQSITILSNHSIDWHSHETDVFGFLHAWNVSVVRGVAVESITLASPGNSVEMFHIFVLYISLSRKSPHGQPFKNTQKVMAQLFVGCISVGPIRFHLWLMFKSTMLPLGARCAACNAAQHRGNYLNSCLSQSRVEKSRQCCSLIVFELGITRLFW